MKRKNLVVLTGAGMSAESGIATFRDAGGLWEQHRIEDVASPQGWKRNPGLVLDFYNQRRSKIGEAQPNRGHHILAELEQWYAVHIITQNIDDLHERAGSSRILHLHGEITKARSTLDPSLIYSIGYKAINPGDLCERGSQLRPHIVWFGEEVPMMEEAAHVAATADIFLVVGTSLQVYPAASLVHFTQAPLRLVVDPHVPSLTGTGWKSWAESASAGLEKVKQMLQSDFK